MSAKREMAGINIQWPWSALLLDGTKTIETRSYPLPQKHLMQELAIIETPGPRGLKEADIHSARIIGVIVFSGCYQYPDWHAWAADRERHRVALNDPLFGFVPGKAKWAWIVARVEALADAAPVPAKRGIVFASACVIP